VRDWLLGEYDNWEQAHRDPTKFSHVRLKYEDVGNGDIHVLQWYVHRPEEPYRERWHRLHTIDENTVIVQNFLKDWTRNENCDMICRYSGTKWVGEGGACCTARGFKVESFFNLTENGIVCYDIGLKEDGSRAFGGRDPYIFEKLVT
tara:strand:+ start:9684 stop:10124 length:441 start_codon:yes stop_codon:yes gene_type:complete